VRRLLRLGTGHRHHAGEATKSDSR
jgi:hypothetical protein